MLGGGGAYSIATALETQSKPWFNNTEDENSCSGGQFLGFDGQ
jgi:hypothetical protein